MSEIAAARRFDRIFRLALVLLVVLWGAFAQGPAHPGQALGTAQHAKDVRS